MSLIYKGKVVGGYDDFEVIDWRTHGCEFKLGRDAVKKRVVPCTQGVAHWTGGEGTFKGCYNTLRKRVTPKAPKGLSVQFYMNQEGTIYQYCDLDLSCVHAGAPTNGKSYAMEIACKGFPPASSKHPRGIYRDEVHGKPRRMLFMYPEQIDAAIAFFGFVNDLLGIPQRLPRIQGEVPKTVVPSRYRRTFKGLLAHYHISYQKHDPGTNTIAAFEDEGW